MNAIAVVATAALALAGCTDDSTSGLSSPGRSQPVDSAMDGSPPPQAPGTTGSSTSGALPPIEQSVTPEPQGDLPSAPRPVEETTSPAGGMDKGPTLRDQGAGTAPHEVFPGSPTGPSTGTGTSDR
jgi:hypothetical protein